MIKFSDFFYILLFCMIIFFNFGIFGLQVEFNNFDNSKAHYKLRVFQHKLLGFQVFASFYNQGQYYKKNEKHENAKILMKIGIVFNRLNTFFYPVIFLDFLFKGAQCEPCVAEFRFKKNLFFIVRSYYKTLIKLTLYPYEAQTLGPFTRFILIFYMNN